MLPLLRSPGPGVSGARLGDRQPHANPCRELRLGRLWIKGGAFNDMASRV